MVWSSLAPKWPIMVPFCGIDHQKSNFSLIFGIFSVGGCWGQAMLLFWKLVDETQMAAPREYTDAFIITKKLFLGGLRGLQSNSIWYETPCIWDLNFFNLEFTYETGISGASLWLLECYLMISISLFFFSHFLVSLLLFYTFYIFCLSSSPTYLLSRSWMNEWSYWISLESF